MATNGTWNDMPPGCKHVFGGYYKIPHHNSHYSEVTAAENVNMQKNHKMYVNQIVSINK